MSDDIKKPDEGVEPKNEGISAEDLEKVSGGADSSGKVTFNPFQITRKTDSASH